MTRKGVAQMLTAFESALRAKFTQKDVEVWGFILSDVSDEEGMEAAKRLCNIAEYPPKTSDVRRLVDESRVRHPAHVPLSLPKPQEVTDPEGVARAQAFIREALEKIGKPMP